MVSMVTTEETGAHSNEAGYSASTQGAKAVRHFRKIRIYTNLSEWLACQRALLSEGTAALSSVSGPGPSSCQPLIPFNHHQSFLKLFWALSPFADKEMEATSQDCWVFECDYDPAMHLMKDRRT